MELAYFVQLQYPSRVFFHGGYNLDFKIFLGFMATFIAIKHTVVKSGSVRKKIWIEMPEAKSSIPYVITIFFPFILPVDFLF